MAEGKLLFRVCESAVSLTKFSTPVGQYVVASCSKGIHSIDNRDDKGGVSLQIGTKLASDSVKQLTTGTASTDKLLPWLEVFFSAGEDKVFPPAPAVCLPRTKADTFSAKVWAALYNEVHAGRTMTYGELATFCGNPKGSRAVGQAMRRNPWSLLVPCHRVVTSGGGIGNYSGGQLNPVKHWLLEHEHAVEQ